MPAVAALFSGCGEQESFGSGTAIPTQDYDPPSFEIGRIEGGRFEPIPNEAALGFDGATPQGWSTQVQSGSTRGTSVPEDGLVGCGTLWVLPHRSDPILEMVAVKVVTELRRSRLIDRIRFLPVGSVLEDGGARPDLFLTLWSDGEIARVEDRRFEWTVFGSLGNELVPGAVASTEPGVPARAVLTDRMSTKAELVIQGDPRSGFASQVLVAEIGEGLAKEITDGLRSRIADHGRARQTPVELLGDYEPVPIDVEELLADWRRKGSVRGLRFSNQTWWVLGRDDGKAAAAFEELRTELKAIGFEGRDGRDLLMERWVRGRETIDLTERSPNVPSDAPSDRYPNWLRVRLRIERPGGWEEEFVEAALALEGEEALRLAEAASLRTIVPESEQRAFWERLSERADRGAQDFVVLARVSHRTGDDQEALLFLRAADLMMKLVSDSGVAEGLPKRLAERWELEFPGPAWTEAELDGLGIPPWQSGEAEEFTLGPGQVVVRRHPDLSAEVLGGPRFVAAGRSGTFPDRFYLSSVGAGHSSTWSDDGPMALSLWEGARSIKVTPSGPLDESGVLRVRLRVD